MILYIYSFSQSKVPTQLVYLCVSTITSPLESGQTFIIGLGQYIDNRYRHPKMNRLSISSYTIMIIEQSVAVLRHIESIAHVIE